MSKTAWERTAIVSGRELDALNSLAGYASTAQLSNTSEWLDGLRQRIQELLDAEGKGQKCEREGDRLVIR